MAGLGDLREKITFSAGAAGDQPPRPRGGTTGKALLAGGGAPKQQAELVGRARYQGCGGGNRCVHDIFRRILLFFCKDDVTVCDEP